MNNYYNNIFELPRNTQDKTANTPRFSKIVLYYFSPPEGYTTLDANSVVFITRHEHGRGDELVIHAYDVIVFHGGGLLTKIN